MLQTLHGADPHVLSPRSSFAMACPLSVSRVVSPFRIAPSSSSATAARSIQSAYSAASSRLADERAVDGGVHEDQGGGHGAFGGQPGRRPSVP